MSIGDLEIWFLEHTFERFSHWWQRDVAGTQDCFFWSRVSFLLYLITFFQILWPITLLIAFLGSTTILIYEYDTKKSQSSKCMNPYKVAATFVRCLFYFIGINISAGMLIAGYTLLTFSAFLFPVMFCLACCNPLPPAKSKARQWLEKGAQKIEQFFSPALEPAPVPIPASSRYR